MKYRQTDSVGFIRGKRMGLFIFPFASAIHRLQNTIYIGKINTRFIKIMEKLETKTVITFHFIFKDQSVSTLISRH